MKTQHYTRHFTNKLTSVKELKNFIFQIGKAHKAQMAVVRHIQLSLEELVVNIISYGYTDRKTHTIELKVNCHKNYFAFYLNHSGTPFNPLTFKRHLLSDQLKDEKTGGVGILLARSFMDKMSYRYADGCNCITLIKKKNPSKKPVTA